jgi:adenine-specific DNA-methyltransferase
MIRDEIETVETTSPDLLVEQIEQLKRIFPQVFSEGKIDFTKLRAALGDAVDTQPERYSFTWAGKRESIQLLQTPSAATLVPAKEESINFDDTQNLFIEGDNLEVLKLLYKSYSGRIKMIYIDPPYNTGSDFLYPDDFAHPLDTYLKLTEQKDARGNLLTSNPETSGRYHSAWLSMMYPRLYLARQLLQEDGVIFVSIDDHEVSNLRELMNQVFGEENFVTTIIWEKKYAAQNDTRWFSDTHDYILVYALNKELWRPHLLPRTEEANARYSNPDNDPRGDWKADNLAVKTYTPTTDYPITTPSGRVVKPPAGSCWRVSRERFDELVIDNRIWFGKDGSNVPALKRFLSEVKEGMVPKTIWFRKDVGDNQEAKQELNALLSGVDVFFDTPKPVRLLKKILQLSTVSGEPSIVLDFFAGSGTLGQAVMELNREDDGDRKFILVQLPETTSSTTFPTIAHLCQERLRRVVEKLKSEDDGKLGLTTRKAPEDLGFKVFRLALSNYKQWQSVDSSDAEAYVNQLAFFADPLVEGWKPESVIWEVAIKEGYGLNAVIKRLENVHDNTVWQVTDPDKGQCFLICLDSTLHQATLAALPLMKDRVFVCLNSTLDDTIAANLALQCRLKKI